MAASTVNREDYSHQASETQRPEPARPKESNVLKAEGKFDHETITSSEFKPKQPDRHQFETRRENDEFWKVSLYKVISLKISNMKFVLKT